MPATSDLPSFMVADATIKGLALSFVEELEAASYYDRPDINADREDLNGVAPSINTIAFGALTYRDVRDASMADHVSPRDDYLTLRTYSIDYHKTYDGTRIPVLVQIAKGCTSGIDVTHRSVSILEPYWLA